MPDMRFAPPNPLRIADRASGLNATSVRSYNERLVLSLLLQNQSTTRLEIGERTGLSAQTVSVLVRSLEQEGLVAKGEAQKGRVGPPTVPIVLNSEGAFSIGISVGNRRTDVVLIDFVGKVRFHTMLANPKVNRSTNHSEFLNTIRKAISMLPKKARERLAGVGLALPYSFSSGRDQEGYFNALQIEIEEHLGVSVFVQNDITAAVSGESMFGVAKPLSDYMYFYLGANLHGRLVLNHQIYNGNSPLSFDVGMAALEKELAKHRQPLEPLWERTGSWPDYGDLLIAWEGRLIDQMAQSLESVSQFVEFETVVLSSYAPPEICGDICRKLEAQTGVRAVAGNITPSPKAVGAASLPFSSRFIVE
ncbi:ROK family transcriptional regulator [Bradyrhizobium sp.]|uniref:ROK family transcriptional regulator n=2 Tax=Bradyrhizobium sp. TaxID=376 RepID=UPI0025C3AEA9|nr:ROK family transcriptional regulator [Bradyrhizobium sp.]